MKNKYEGQFPETQKKNESQSKSGLEKGHKQIEMCKYSKQNEKYKNKGSMPACSCAYCAKAEPDISHGNC